MVDHLVPIRLSESGRPVLLESEIETALQHNVSLYDGNEKTKFENGVARVTSHRLLWFSDDTVPGSVVHVAIGIALSLVAATDTKSVRKVSLNASPKIGVLLHGERGYIRLSFRSGGRDTFLSRLNKALAAKAWEREAERSTASVSSGSVRTGSGSQLSSLRKAGISGIIQTVNDRAKETDESLATTFADVDSLMENAKEMVALARKFSEMQEKASDDEKVAMNQFLIRMGIASPVTKETAGARYHVELARQLCDFLREPLERFGMIALCDVYCLYNRARGTALISPEDLYRACMLFESLSLPVQLRQFASGVIVVQGEHFSDDAMYDRLLACVREHGPQSAHSIANALQLSINVATEHLTGAEQAEVLCRDESASGLLFHENLFSKYAAQLQT